MDEPRFTHYSAQIKLKGHYFPHRARLTDAEALCLANNGTTPSRISPKLREKADKLMAALMAGRMVMTPVAEIYPLTDEEYEAGKLSRPTEYVKL